MEMTGQVPPKHEDNSTARMAWHPTAQKTLHHYENVKSQISPNYRISNLS